MDKEKTLRKLKQEIDEVREKFGIEFAEVVRCKDCDRRAKSADLTDTVYCPWLKQQMRKTDFCSYGERRDNDGRE